MPTRKGSCVNRIVNTSAASNGARRRHADPNGSPTRPFAGTLSVASAVLMNRLLDRLRCDVLALPESVVSFIEPEITLEKSWVQRLPTSWDCGTPTYCTPG